MRDKGFEPLQALSHKSLNLAHLTTLAIPHIYAEGLSHSIGSLETNECKVFLYFTFWQSRTIKTTCGFYESCNPTGSCKISLISAYKKFYKATCLTNFEDGHNRLETPVPIPNTEVKLPMLVMLVPDKARSH